MGSLATQNEYAMNVLANFLKENNLFFLDSLVGDNTIAKQLCQRLQIKYYTRDIFIDNEASPEHIKNQLKKLIEIARINSGAIGIGHCRELTLKTLKEFIPEFKKNKVEFVTIDKM
jgi:hypothetical protein